MMVSLCATRSEDVVLTNTYMAVDAGETCRANQMWIPGPTGLGLHLGITAFSSEA